MMCFDLWVGLWWFRWGLPEIGENHQSSSTYSWDLPLKKNQPFWGTSINGKHHINQRWSNSLPPHWIGNIQGIWIPLAPNRSLITTIYSLYIVYMSSLFSTAPWHGVPVFHGLRRVAASFLSSILSGHHGLMSQSQLTMTGWPGGSHKAEPWRLSLRDGWWILIKCIYLYINLFIYIYIYILIYIYKDIDINYSTWLNWFFKCFFNICLWFRHMKNPPMIIWTHAPSSLKADGTLTLHDLNFQMSFK